MSGQTHGFGFSLEFPQDDLAYENRRVIPVPARLNKLAVGSGFAAALLCTALMIPQLSAVLAENDGGSNSFFLHEAKVRSNVPRPVAAVPSLGTGSYAFVAAPVRARVVAAKWTRAVRSAPVRSAGAPLEIGGLSGKHSVCVRLCDGYYFPVGGISNDSDVASQESACNNMCPGAPARLYVLPSGSDKMEEALSVRERKPYTALPVAFRYADKTERTCSCHAATEQSSVALLQDFTLRKGDGVMTPKGIKVFRGAQHWPYKRNDFLSLAETRDVTGLDRGALAAIEQAAKGLRPAVARTKSKVPEQPGRANAAPIRTMRDANGKDIRIVGPQAMLEP